MKITETLYANSPVWLQNQLIAGYGFYWKKRRFSSVFQQEYIQAKHRESFTALQWNDYVQQHLQQLLLHAFNTVPFYKEKFLRLGINKHYLQKIATTTLFEIPILTKEEFRKFGSTRLLSSKCEPNGIFLKSSGSTGTPTATRFSHKMHQKWFALMESRVRNWAGVSSEIPRGMIGGRKIMGKKEHAPFYRYNPFEKQTYFSAYHINKNNAANYLYGMQRNKVQYMTGYAMSNYFLANLFAQAELKAPGLKAVITSSEVLTTEMRKLLENVYDCKVNNSWSGVEACGLISECRAGNLHINLDAGLIELLDANLQPVKTGTAGEAYCTGFLNFDQPLIRYKIGDQMVFDDAKCTCGCHLPIVKEISGRNEDIIYGKDGRQMVRFHQVFSQIPVIQKGQVCQQSLESILLRFISDRNLLPSEISILKNEIQSQLGKVEIKIERVDHIPLTANGKFKAVISELDKGRRSIIYS